jgi:CHASE3 domain sensor protein
VQVCTHAAFNLHYLTFLLFTMSFAQRLSIGIILAAALCAGAVYYTWQQIETLTANLQDTSHQERVIATSERLLEQFISMETSARSFLITGVEDDLQPFSRNVGEVALSLRELRTVSQPLTPERSSALAFLDATIDKKVNETNYAIILRREQGIKISAFALVKNGKVNAADTITQVLRRIHLEEEASSKNRIKSIPEQYHALVPPMLCGIVAAALVLILFGVWASLAQHSALKPVVEGAEKLALGDVRHRIAPGGTSDVKPIVTALNGLGEQLLSRQGSERKTEDIVADIFHATTEPVAVWRARRNGLGQITDFECLLANPAFGMAYKHPADVLTGSLLTSSRFSDVHSMMDSFVRAVEKQQPLSLSHTLHGKQYRLSAAKMRDGILLRLSEQV